MRHYTYEELDRYLNGDLPRICRWLCARHLKKCESCAVLLKHVREANDLLYGRPKTKE